MRIAVISGSLQKRSSNSALVRAAVAVAPEHQQLGIFRSLADVPHLNPELDGDTAPAAVRELREQMQAADGVLIATPEYGHSVPGVLKNALDWLVGSGELSGMPVAVMSASTTHTGGIRGQMALVQTLLAQAAHVVTMLTVPGVKDKLDLRGEIEDPAVLRRVGEALVALGEASDERKAWNTSP